MVKTPPKPIVERVEPEKIKKWREEQQKRLTEKGKTDSFIENLKIRRRH